MRILRDYLLKELIQFFFTCLAIMTLVFLIGNILTKLADLVINEGVDLGLLVQLVLNSIPFLFVFTIPMSLLVAVLLTFGRLSADHEIVAVKASGISLIKLIKPVFLVSIVLSLLLFYLTDRVAPQTHFRVRKLTAEIGMKTPASIIEEGVFIKRFKNFVLFVHRKKGNELQGIRIYLPQTEGPTRTIVAHEGHIIPLPEQNLIKLKLMNGTIDEPKSDDPRQFYKLNFTTYQLPLELSDAKLEGPLQKKPKELSVRELWSEYQDLKVNAKFIAHNLMAEIHQKFAISLGVIVFGLMGVPLAITLKRGEKYIGFAVAIIIAALYWTTLVGVMALAKTGILPSFICLHLPNTLLLLYSLSLINRHLRV